MTGVGVSVLVEEDPLPVAVRVGVLVRVAAVPVVVRVPVTVPPVTTIFTNTWSPKNVPAAFCILQYPMYVPGESGAYIPTEIFTASPAATVPVIFVVEPSILLPLRYASAYEVVQSQVPELRRLHVFINEPPGAITVPSGMVMSLT